MNPDFCSGVAALAAFRRQYRGAACLRSNFHAHFGRIPHVLPDK